MEIVLAVLLLFGGFTLGSITADKGDDDVAIHTGPAQWGWRTGFDSGYTGTAPERSDPVSF